MLYLSTHLEGLTLYDLAEKYKVHTKGCCPLLVTAQKCEGEYGVERVSLT